MTKNREETMKHGRKTGWTRDRWLAYVAAAAVYHAAVCAAPSRRQLVARAVAEMMDRED